MRTYGRITNPDGSLTWVQVATDANGHDDLCYITTLIQCLKLSPGESPFFAAIGIPKYQTVLSQVYPDYYVDQIRLYFSRFFASLSISRQEATLLDVNPVYNVKIVTNQGFVINRDIPT